MEITELYPSVTSAPPWRINDLLLTVRSTNSIVARCWRRPHVYIHVHIVFTLNDLRTQIAQVLFRFFSLPACVIIERFVNALIGRLHSWVHWTGWQLVVYVVTVVGIALRFGWKFHHVVASRIILSCAPNTVNVLNATDVVTFLVHCNLGLVAGVVLGLANTTCRKHSLPSLR
jgi:hypothetical protein